MFHAGIYHHLNVPILFKKQFNILQEVGVWEDNWNDNEVDDNFSVQLRNELEESNSKGK